VRVIHAAPELGSPDLTVDAKEAVKSLAFTDATPYVPLTPGAHTLGAMRPGGSVSLVSGGKVTLSPGVAYSAIVVGSRGQRVRVVTVVDRGGPLARPASNQPGGTAHTGRRSLVVKPGDSLWSIARSLLPAHADNAAIQRKVVAIWD